MFKVIIAGGRKFNDYKLLTNTLDFLLLNKIEQGFEIVIVCGKAKGADSLGERYAKEKGFKVEEYPADWDKFGKSAGYIRNKQMAEVADACCCFWDGNSPGTKHMIELAKKYKLLLEIVYY